VLLCQEAVTVVESAYNNYANATQRAAMAAEFYGKTFSVFRVRPETVTDCFTLLKQRQLKISTPVTPALGDVHANLVFRPFCSSVRSLYGTDGQTDGQDP